MTPHRERSQAGVYEAGKSEKAVEKTLAEIRDDQAERSEEANEAAVNEGTAVPR
jgi:hypothetical protein